MPNYRRNYLNGGTFFFTVNLADRRSDLLIREIQTLRACVSAVRKKSPFEIDAFVVLPEHLHCIWTLPEGDTRYSERWREIKKMFTKAVIVAAPPDVVARFGRGVWQKRFWEHTIRDERDFNNHIDYVHFNPVKHGYVESPGEWPYSTFRRCVAVGFYDAAWVSPQRGELVDMGERT